MSRIRSKFIRWGVSTDDVNSRSMPANYTPSNYTPAQVGSEGNDKVSAHLNGINSALGSVVPVTGDITLTSFTSTNNTPSSESVTGLTFANASVRSFRAQVSVSLSATASLYTVYDVMGVQRGSDWIITYTHTGDDAGLTFNITAAGQIQYSKSSNAGFTQTKFSFRATVTHV